MSPDNEMTNTTDETSQSSTDGKKLKVSIREGQSWTRFLEIEVPVEDINSQFETTYQTYRKKAKIPGFRPGKAPMGIVKQHFADAVKADVFEDAVSKAYEQALVQEKLAPLDMPKLSDIEFDEGKPLKFKAEIEIRPTVTLGKYKGYRIEKKVPEIGEKDLNESLDYLRERMAEFEPVQRPAENGDMIIADLVKKHDKLGKLKEEKLENVEIELGSNRILDEFQRGLMGMRIGEMKDISVKYPDNYFDTNLAGNQILFLAVVKEIKKKNLPDLNDEFAAKVSNLKTLEELKTRVKDNLQRQAQDDATKNLRNEILKRVIDDNRFDVPSSLVKKYLDHVVEDFKKRGETVDENQVRSEYRNMAEDYIRWSYLYYEIAHAENIKVAAEDRQRWVQAFAKTYNLSEEAARQALGKSKKKEDIDDSILESKVVEYIISNSEVITA